MCIGLHEPRYLQNKQKRKRLQAKNVLLLTFLSCSSPRDYCTRPVAEGGGVTGSEDPPNFQKFTNLVAVIHSLLQLSLIVRRKQW